jgi:uncharacterized protein YndB with AHSA1/START domain
MSALHHCNAGVRTAVARRVASVWLASLAFAGMAHAQTPAPSPVVTVLTAEADGTTTLDQRVVVNAPLAEAWQALTTSEGWRGWAAPFAMVDFRLGGFIETSYRPDAQAGAPENIRNQIIAYLPNRMFAIRNVQAPPKAAFDVATFQSMHTVVLLEPLSDRTTAVAFVQPGYRSGEPYDTVLKHFRWGNGWTLEQLKKRFDVGPVDWARLAAEAQKAAKK